MLSSVAAEAVEAVRDMHPLKRIAKPQEIARLIAFAVADANLTGCDLVSDAGASISAQKIL